MVVYTITVSLNQSFNQSSKFITQYTQYFHLIDLKLSLMSLFRLILWSLDIMLHELCPFNFSKFFIENIYASEGTEITSLDLACSQIRFVNSPTELWTGWSTKISTADPIIRLVIERSKVNVENIAGQVIVKSKLHNVIIQAILNHRKRFIGHCYFSGTLHVL